MVFLRQCLLHSLSSGLERLGPVTCWNALLQLSLLQSCHTSGPENTLGNFCGQTVDKLVCWFTSPMEESKAEESCFNPLNPELNPICYLLALLVHHFLHVSRIRVKSLTLRLLMSYIYMERIFLMFLDHTQRRTTVGRTPLDE